MSGEIRVDGFDPDPMAARGVVLVDEDVSGLAAIAVYYRAKWSEASGRLAEIDRVIEAKDEMIAFLRGPGGEGREAMTRDELLQAIAKANRLVEAMPAWKRGILAQSSRSNVSRPRLPVDNFNVLRKRAKPCD